MDKWKAPEDREVSLWEAGGPGAGGEKSLLPKERVP